MAGTDSPRIRSRLFRRILIGVGFFIAANLVWIFAFGRPKELLNIPIGLYQGFSCGWDSVVQDVFTCDRGTDE